MVSVYRYMVIFYRYMVSVCRYMAIHLSLHDGRPWAHAPKSREWPQ
jgi:hypothetical protein